ncbi:MAG: type IV secretion system protein [Rickettsiales bacterium]|jgi:hypothetical protein|nr:type IV secretion system protein [Rickettsiales bacterium]
MKIRSFFIFPLVIAGVVALGPRNGCLAECNTKNDYCYNTCGRELGDDNDLPPGSDNSVLKNIMTTLKLVPGVSLLAPAVAYIVMVITITVSGNEDGAEVESDVKSIEGIAMAGSIMADIFAPSNVEGTSAIAMQVVFGTNLYCKQQKVYVEETKYLTKMETSPDGGYPMFPIYPLDIKVNEATGQCDLKRAVDNNVLAPLHLLSSRTKCSYSFSATNKTCILLNIPLFAAFIAEMPVVESICIISSPNPSQATSKIKKALEIGVKIAQLAITTVELAANIFFDNKLALDPITMFAVMSINTTFDLLMNLPFDIGKQNWPCVATRILAAQAVQTAAAITIVVKSDAIRERAKAALKKYGFCGHDWLSYQKTEDGKYWVRGGYKHSHYMTVVDAIEHRTVKKSVDEQIYREYVYGGREHISYASNREEMLEDGVGGDDNRAKTINYETKYCIDPRTKAQKGFEGIFQRYYMRGNEKANFACNRFLYDGMSGCFLPEEDVESEDMLTATEIVAEKNGIKYYLVKGEKYDRLCQKVFIEARKCCRHRSKHLVCIHDKSKNGVEDGTFCLSNVIDGYGGELSSSLFTFIVNRNADLDKTTCKIDGFEFETGKKKNTDYVCVFSGNLCPYDFKLNAGLNYRASYCDTDYFTNYRDPNSTLQREATHFNAATCREGLFSEKFRRKYKEQFSSAGKKFAAFTYNNVKKDMADIVDFNRNDFETIYNFDGYKDSNGNIIKKPFKEAFNYSEAEAVNRRSCGFRNSPALDTTTSTYAQYNLKPAEVNYLKSSAFGQVKNFCQYRAHCVEVEREENYEDNYLVGSLFLDSSCNGTTTNSRNILQDEGGGVPRQLCAPIVECIFESLKNLIAGVAGNSLCEDGEDLNSSGYCGTDSEAEVLEQATLGNSAFFEGRYRKVDGKFIVKNQKLPINYNPFLKIQRYFINIIKAALTLFMVIYFYKQALTGNLENLAKPENIMKMILPLFKFAVVTWLVFYNGWQQGAYDHIVNFSTAGYSFLSRIFVKSLGNPRNQMLDLAENSLNVIKIVEKNSVTLSDRDIMLCFSYDIFGNIHYSRRDSLTEKCAKGFHSNYGIDSDWGEAIKIFIRERNYSGQMEKNIVISSNQEISQLLYFIDKYNEHNSDKLRIEVVSGNLWSEKYDGCYFDTSEYEENKSYLALFDMLDCKLIKYLGYSTNKMAPNILLYSAIMLVPNYFFPDGIVSKVIGGIGSFLFGMMMTFLFLVIGVLIKAVYIFTSAFFTLSILIFVSPIVLPLMFFERTKTIFNTWLEYLMDTILKPIMNFAFTVMYVNVMDIILLKDVTFSKHSIRGRGVNLECPSDSSSFICLIGGIPIVSQISILYNSGLKNVLFDVVIVFLFFTLFDQVLDSLESISSAIFKNISDVTKSSSSLTSSSDDKLGIGSIGGQALGRAMEAGKQLESFRETYVNNAPGALLSGIRNAAGRVADARLDKDGKPLKPEDRKGFASLAGGIRNFYDRVAGAKEKLENSVVRARHNASRIAKQRLKAVGRKVGKGLSKLWNEGAIQRGLDKEAARTLMEEAEKLKYGSDGDTPSSRKAKGEYKAKMQALEKLNTSPNLIGQLIGEQTESIEAKRTKLGGGRAGAKEMARLESEVKCQEDMIADLRAIAKKNLKKESTAKRFLKKNMKLQKKSKAGGKDRQKYDASMEEIKSLGLSGEEIDELLPQVAELKEEIKNEEDSEALDDFLAALRTMEEV